MKTEDGLIRAVCQGCGDHIIVAEIIELHNGTDNQTHMKDLGNGSFGKSHLAEFMSLDDFIKAGYELLEKE